MSTFESYNALNTLMVDENGTPSAISIGRTITFKRSINHPRRSKTSNTSSEDETIFRETPSVKEVGINPTLLKNSIKETRDTFSRNKDSYAEARVPVATHATQNASNEGIPDSKETLHGS